jgi:molecular chaperone GrpE
MTSDPTNAAESDPARSPAQAPEADLPQAPPGALEGHDGVSSAEAEGLGSFADGQPPEDLEVDVAALTEKAQKADEYLELAKRTKADFENYRKRAVREAATAQERGAVKLALALLPAIDNLDRALAHAESVTPTEDSNPPAPANGTASLLAGIKHVQTDVIAALARVGIESFSPEGEPFDPQYHEAVAQQPVEGAEPGVVVEVFQRGYRLGESVVRPARVVVAG